MTVTGGLAGIAANDPVSDGLGTSDTAVVHHRWQNQRSLHTCVGHVFRSACGRKLDCHIWDGRSISLPSPAAFRGSCCVHVRYFVPSWDGRALAPGCVII